MSAQEPVGPLADEAAKLLAALQSWAGGGSSEDPGTHEHGVGPAECRWCPHCRIVKLVGTASPEVREHLGQAALSLALAVKGLLETPAPPGRGASSVEKIDLTEE